MAILQKPVKKREKWARCNGYTEKCRGWVHIDEASVLECPACTYRSIRCDQCGGWDSAWLGLKKHWGWFRAVGEGIGGHAERLREWFETAFASYHKTGDVVPLHKYKDKKAA